MKIFWMHTDCLREPPVSCDQAVFFFDDEQIAGWSLKRVMFVHECLLELPVEIRHGAPVFEGAARVVTVDSPDPWIRGQIERLRGEVEVDVLPAPEFVHLTEPVDLRRFARYWRKAESQLLA
jgi:hypothetical protein